jgi:hypothetical protein
VNADLVQRFFDALVAIRLDAESTRSCNASCVSELSEQPKRRIIYLRDFDSIRQSARPLMIHILRGLHKSRTRTDVSDVSGQCSAPPTTIIVLGIPKYVDQVNAYTFPGLGPGVPQTNGVFNFPLSLGDVSPMFKSKVSQRCLKVLFSQILKLVRTPSPKSPKISVDAIWKKRVDGLASSTVAVAVFVDNGHAEEFQQWQRLAVSQRNRDVNNLLLRMCLGKKSHSAKNLFEVIGEDMRRYDIYQTLWMIALH